MSMFDDEMFSSDSNTRGLADAFRRTDAMKASAHGSDSFSYKAPVQPKKQPPASPAAAATTPAASPARPAVLNFCQVTAFKHVGGTPTSMGQLGAAVIGGVGCPTAQLLLYKTQKEHLCTADITSAFRYTLPGDHYASFYSNDQVAWSIRFASAEAERAFAIHVALAQFLVGGMHAMVTLDEAVPKSGTHVVASGDTLGIKYTAWLVAENGACGKQLDTNTDKSAFYKLRVGDRGAMLAGWHDALVGMKKGGKRLVVLPPALAYGEAGAPPTVPPNTPAVFELEVCKLKSAAHTASASSIPSSPAAAHRPSDYQVVVATPLKTQPAQEQPQQQQLQQLQQVQQQVQQPQQQQQQQQQPYYAGAVAMYNPAQQAQPAMQPMQPVQQPAAPVYQAPQMAPLAAAPGLTTADTVQMMMEDRQFRSDLKATLAVFQAKLEEVTSWVKEMRQPAAKDENVEVSGMVVIQTMQKLVDQSERCRYEAQDKEQAIASLTEKVRELQDSNQRFVEESTKMMAMRDDAHRRELEQARMQYDALSSDKSRVQAELAQAALALENVQAQLAAQTAATAQVQAELARSQEETRGVAAALEETKLLVQAGNERAARDQQALQDEQRARAELGATVDALQRKLAEQKDALANAEQLAEMQKARAASEIARMESEQQAKCSELDAQVVRLKKQIAKIEASTPDVAQIEADAEKKWRRKAELAIEEARVATDEAYMKKLQDAERKLKAARAEKEQLEEQLDAAQAAARRAAREASDAAPMRVVVTAPAVATAPAAVRVKKVYVKTGVPVHEARAALAAVQKRHHDELVDAVKNGMNGVFHALKELIDTDETYDGNAVLNAIKRTIKKTTLEYLGELEEKETDDDEFEQAFKKAEEAEAQQKHQESDSDSEEEQAKRSDDDEIDVKAPKQEQDDEKEEEETEKEVQQASDEKDADEDIKLEETEAAVPEKTEAEEADDAEQKEDDKEDIQEEQETKEAQEPAVGDVTEFAAEQDKEDSDQEIETKEEEQEETPAKEHDDDVKEVSEPSVQETEEPAKKEEPQQEAAGDGRIATKPLFLDDEDDEDDIQITAEVSASATSTTEASPAPKQPVPKLFEDDDDDGDWGDDDDPLAFLHKK